uniref:Putative secreted protein n=1 Tax=Anopheles darlingi TaxID=43151 RepID=A0A2M4DA24_ANODA
MWIRLHVCVRVCVCVASGGNHRFTRTHTDTREQTDRGDAFECTNTPPSVAPHATAFECRSIGGGAG